MEILITRVVNGYKAIVDEKDEFVAESTDSLGLRIAQEIAHSLGGVPSLPRQDPTGPYKNPKDFIGKKITITIK